MGLPPTTAPCPHCGVSVTSPDQNALPVSQPQAAGSTSEEMASQSKNQVAVPPAPTEDQPIRLNADQERAPVPPAAAAGAAPQELDKASNAVFSSIEDIKSLENTKTGAKKGTVPMVCAAIVILLLAGGATIWLAGKKEKDQTDSSDVTTVDQPAEPKEDGIEEDWKEEISEVLNDFLIASTPEEKMKYVIAYKGVLEDLKTYFPAGEVTDTPLSSFSFYDANEEDRKRGIFLMRYRRPAQIDIREYFAPIGSLEMVMGQASPTLIETAYRIDEESLSEPVGINAFFKKTDDGLKLDSSVFIQGKFRTFKAFTEYAQPGKSKIFRVVINETFSHALREDTSRRAYKFADFAYPQDFVNLPIEIDSEEGNVLSKLNWRGTNKSVFHRTATVELTWSDTSPSKLELKRVLCWEFLGVGGELGNTASTPEDEGKTP